jgi:hypothetical protein
VHCHALPFARDPTEVDSHMAIQTNYPWNTADTVTWRTASGGYTTARIEWDDGRYLDLAEESRELVAAELRQLGFDAHV